ncbi:MAG: 30S ribosomal protein S8 [Acidobacteria bacterium]|nr:30S ribosomal protein S8 [Acidobacteriota bacterium]
MNTTDPIADMLTRIRNAVRSRHPRVGMPSSRLKAEVARVLKEEGYLSSYKVVEENRKKTLRIGLKYSASQGPAISKLMRISRPGRRVYASRSEIYPVLGGLGNSILTTPKGVMTGKRARKAGVGGEILLEVW